MNNNYNKLNLNEFILYFCAIHILTLLWIFILFFFTLIMIVLLKSHHEIGVSIFIFVYLSLFAGFFAYIAYWIAKGLIMQKKLRAILAIIIINYSSYHLLKYDFNSIMIIVYHIILSIFLIYSITYSLIYSLKGKE